MNKFFSFLFVVLFLTACTDEVPVPKPRMFPRVDFPEKKYTTFDENYCAFTFDKPAYAKIVQDTNYFDEKAKNSCWFNIETEALSARIHCSYNPISSRADFDKLVSDNHELVNKHTIKATYIDELPISRPSDNVYGVYFDIEGPVASTTQFFLTDSTHHFLRGALYFDTKTKTDSLAPVIDFFRADIKQMMGTLKWNRFLN